MTPDQQLDELRAAARRNVAGWFGAFCLVATGVCAILGATTGSSWAWMAIVVFAVLGLSALEVSPHLKRAAASSMSRAETEQATVRIEIESDSESENFVAYVSGLSSELTWAVRFNPIGWRPDPGTYAAEAFFHGNVDWPALLRLPGGWIVPRYRPKRNPRNA